MLAISIFILGLLLGGIIGVAIMCLMQINRVQPQQSNKKEKKE